jgi:hypothetical protein
MAEVSLVISESLGLFGLSNPCVSRGTSFVDDSESLGSLYALESKRPRGSTFVDDVSVPRSVCAVEAMLHPWQKFR